MDPGNPLWGVVDGVGSIVSSGIGFVDPLLGAIARPAIEGITQLAGQAGKNNVFEGYSGLGSKEDTDDFKRYAKFLEDNPNLSITMDAWKEYDDKVNDKHLSCQKVTITEDMLNGQTVEEYMAARGIEPAQDPAKPTSLGSTRQPTKAEEEALKNVQWGGV
jgi:hypothetical protein